MKYLCCYPVSYLSDCISSLNEFMIHFVFAILKNPKACLYSKGLVVQFRKKHLRKSSLISISIAPYVERYL